MGSNDQVIVSIREALRISPNNVPLRQTLAGLLLGNGQLTEAESEYRQGLMLAPDSRPLKIGLANAFFAQVKMSAATVIVEELLGSGDPSADLLLLHAKLLLASSQAREAAEQYQQALELDPQIADARLAAQLDAAELEASAIDASGAAAAGAAQRAASFSLNGASATGAKSSDHPVLPEPSMSSINFSDVGGMEKVKEDIRIKIIHPLTHPELYKAYGKSTGGGILMYGPPGCGKTHLARAAAGEIQAKFMAVGINDVLDMWIGSSERNLHAIFEQARRRKPCVLFFDEVDALATNRSEMRAGAGRQLINQFLAEMDGVVSNNQGVLLLAATNAPWHIDPAFRRPGRFDSIIFVPPPDLPARIAILQMNLEGKPMGEMDVEAIGGSTEGFSGADLKAVVDLAVEAKLRHAISTGQLAALQTQDLVEAAAKRRPSTAEWFTSAKNYAMYANQGGTYDDVAKYLNL